MNKKSYLLELLIEDKIDEILSTLPQLTTNQSKKDELVVLNARYNDLQRQIRLDIISKETEFQEKSKLRLAIISYINDIKVGDEENKNSNEKLQTNHEQPIVKPRYTLSQIEIEDKYKLGKSLFYEKKHGEAFKYLIQSANAKHPKAQEILGRMHYYGFGVIKDYKQAFTIFSDLSASDDASALYHLGECYSNGHGTKADRNKAIEFYNRAIDLGSVEAFVGIGSVYFNEKDYYNAIDWYQKAYEKGSTEAMHFLAYSYYLGLGVKKDVTASIELYEKAADRGLAIAQRNLGLIYMEMGGMLSRWDKERWGYNEKAAELLKKAAEQDFSNRIDVYYDLGRLYELHLSDQTEGAKWYLKAAENGHSEAQFCIGTMYLFGNGVRKDKSTAIYWCKKAAEQGNANAKSRLWAFYVTFW